MAETRTVEHGITVEWSPQINMDKGTVELYRHHLQPNHEWTSWYRVGVETITGLFAGPAYWFKPIEQRVRIAVERLQARSRQDDAEKIRIRQLESEAAKAIRQ